MPRFHFFTGHDPVRVCRGFALTVAAWLLANHVALPALLRHHEHAPGLKFAPKITTTKLHAPGDPLNVAIVGTEREAALALAAAGWSPSDEATVQRCVRLDVDFTPRPLGDDRREIPLFVFDREQDLAFEREAGAQPDARHRLLLWRTEAEGRNGSPLWIGAAALRRGPGYITRIGRVASVLGPDVDAERDLVIDTLVAAGRVDELFQVTGRGWTRSGHDGSGDRYFTDGELTVGVLARSPRPGLEARRRENPPLVRLKQRVWSLTRPAAVPGRG